MQPRIVMPNESYDSYPCFGFGFDFGFTRSRILLNRMYCG